MTPLKHITPLVHILDLGYSAKEDLSKDQHKLKRGARAKFNEELNNFSEYLKKACASYNNAVNLTYNKYNYIEEVDITNEPNP